MGWRAIKNGELLTLAATRSIAVIVLRAKTNCLADLIPPVPGLLGAIATAKPGVVHIVGEP